MDKAMFDEITESIRQAAAIKRGELPPGRRYKLTAPKAPDAKAVREATGLTQAQFASMLRISIRTLQGWEQRRRTPQGPAAVLLTLVQASPKSVLKTLHG